jgi:spoIIIJ-associated protein
MNYAEGEGRSIDEAIERALQRLGVSRDKVDVEIISNSTRGLFGLGGRRAKVRATLRRPLAVASEAKADPAPALARPVRREPDVPAAPSAPASGAQKNSARQDRDPSPRRAMHPPPPRSRALAKVKRPAAAAPDEASIERGRSVLAEIVRLTGSTASVNAVSDGDGVRLVISGDPSGVLIGRRGQTLDALEYLLNRILAHGDDSNGRLVVDLEDYRQRRRQALAALVQRAAERARRRGKPVTLNPMSPRDRRLVHLTLQDDPGLTTRSAGSGFYRKVVIVPANARRGTRLRSPDS